MQWYGAINDSMTDKTLTLRKIYEYSIQFNSIQFIQRKTNTYSNKTHIDHVSFFWAPREAKLVSGAQINY